MGISRRRKHKPFGSNSSEIKIEVPKVDGPILDRPKERDPPQELLARKYPKRIYRSISNFPFIGQPQEKNTETRKKRETNTKEDLENSNTSTTLDEITLSPTWNNNECEETSPPPSPPSPLSPVSSASTTPSSSAAPSPSNSPTPTKRANNRNSTSSHYSNDPAPPSMSLWAPSRAHRGSIAFIMESDKEKEHLWYTLSLLVPVFRKFVQEEDVLSNRYPHLR